MHQYSQMVMSTLLMVVVFSAPPTEADGQSKVPPPGSPATRPLQPLPEHMKPLMERYMRSACKAPTGPGTIHNSNVSASQVWTAAGSPHLLPFDINISALVTIEACAVVRIAADKTITILPGGAFVALGKNRFPVIIEPAVPGKPWTQIRALGGVLSLTHAMVVGGGASLPALVAQSAALRVQNGSLHVNAVEIVDSQSQGVLLNGTGGFDASSHDLWIHGSVGFPLNVFANLVGSIPSGQYQGNGHDAIGIGLAGGPVRVTQTMWNHGVPYHVGTGQDGGRMDINSQVSGSVAVLTIQPGVTILFPPGGMFFVTGLGALIANAVGEPPIVFTSDQGAPAAGNWIGIRIGNPVNTPTVMNNVKVMFAGGIDSAQSNSCPYPSFPVTNDAAIRILGVPPNQFITNTEFVATGRHSIDRGWQSNMQPDFLATNLFPAGASNLGASCKQTTPKNVTGSNCPMSPTSPPCP